MNGNKSSKKDNETMQRQGWSWSSKKTRSVHPLPSVYVQGMRKRDIVLSLPPHHNLQYHQSPLTPLSYHLPANTTVPDDLREDFVPVRHVTRGKNLTRPIDKKDIVTGAEFDGTIDLIRMI